MLLRSSLLIFVLFLGSCQPKPRPITYGSDGCHYCRMTIVDRIHGAELVTAKGKVFLFDSIECMMHAYVDMDPEVVDLVLCNHYDGPEALIDATQATFLISEELPSPMGANLTAFQSQEAAMQVQITHKGRRYNWSELLQYFRDK